MLYFIYVFPLVNNSIHFACPQKIKALKCVTRNRFEFRFGYNFYDFLEHNIAFTFFIPLLYLNLKIKIKTGPQNA